MNTTTTTDAGWDRLRYLVAQSYRTTYETPGGIVRDKTKKQREIEAAVAEEVVRFAFDHGGYGEGYLAPTGLWMALAKEVGAR